METHVTSVFVALLVIGVLSGGPAQAARKLNVEFGAEELLQCMCDPDLYGCICFDDHAQAASSGKSEPVIDINEEAQGLAWCVPRASTPESVLRQLLDYSCSQGADCSAILPGGPCFPPNTLYAHASFAVNDYWQNKRAEGATCDFQGAAMLVTQDPSDGQCNYPGGPAPALAPKPATTH